MAQSHIKTRNQELGTRKQELKTRNQFGQSLVEILVSITVAFILIGGAAALIAVTLRTSESNQYIQAATFLSHDLTDKVTVYAESLWYCDPGTCSGNRGIYNLVKGSTAANYYLNTTLTPFQYVQVVPPAGENITLDGVQYTRYFYIENVNRNVGGNIDSAGTEDPSTQKVTVKTSWAEGPNSGDVKVEKYLTRNANHLFHQTDWSGGPGQSEKWVEENMFDVSTDINFSASGEIKIQ